MPSVVLTRPGVAFTDAKSKPDEQLLLKSSKTPGLGGRFGTPKSPPFPIHEDEDETALVPYGESIAIGTEATRSYGGPEAVFAMLYTARSRPEARSSRELVPINAKRTCGGRPLMVPCASASRRRSAPRSMIRRRAMHCLRRVVEIGASASSGPKTKSVI